MIRRAAAVLALSAAFAFAAPGADAQEPPPPPGAAPVTPAEWRTEDVAVRVPLRDGAALAADLWLPAKPGRYPVIVVQTPYDRSRFRPILRAAGAAAGASDAATGGFGDGGGGLGTVLDREHYAYLVTDWRGFFGSRSAARGLPTPGRDGYDVVEWAAAQTWCDGKAGTWGPSALGGVQFQTAVEAPPHLVCAVPIVSAYGYRYEDYFESGVFREAHGAALDRLGFGTGSRVRQATSPDAPIYRLARTMERPAQIDVPMLVVTGWFDHGIARTLDTFRTLGTAAGPRWCAGSKLLIGPWHHVAVDQASQGDIAFPDHAGEARREVRAFFDRHLRGVGAEEWDKRPRVRWSRIGEPGWHSSESLPWPAAAKRTLTLHADGRIDGAPPAKDEAPRAIYDDPDDPVPTIGGANLPIGGLLPGPRDQTPLLRRADVLVYTTAPLDEPLRIDGAATLSIAVRTDALDTDVAVRLCEVVADPATKTERTILLTDGIARASFDGRGFTPLEPGEPHRVTVTLPPIALTIAKGSRLSLLVSGTNSPRFERSGHTGRPGYDRATAVAAKVEFLHDAEHPATFTAPVTK